MKAYKKLFLVVICLLWAFPLVANEITILFTHDLHSMFLPHRVKNDEENIVLRGGYARLHTAIKQARAQNPQQTLLIDAGDFSSGSFFYTLFPSDCAELQLMALLGYDVVTFGNHDFDFGIDEMAAALNNAKQSAKNLPKIVSANIKTIGAAPPLSALQAAFDNYGVTEYTIIERNGKRIGIFGIIGDEAIEQAPGAALLTFENKYQSAKRVVKQLREIEKADIVICLSHSGINADSEKSEDVLLAKKVLGIDVIISGHSHTVLSKPIVVNQTTIVSAGCYAEFLGELIIDADKKTVRNYRLIPIDDKLVEDKEIAQKIIDFEQKLNEIYFQSLGRKMNDTVIFSPYHLSKFADENNESLLGTLVADAFVAAAQKQINQKPIAIVPAGTLRNDLYKDYITENDIFSILSLGVGDDGNAGYPLVCVYLYGKELRDLCEIDASCAAIMPEAQLFFSGLRYTYNPHRIFCDKVTLVEVADENENFVIPEKDKLYPMITGLYSAQMLNVVNDKTYGLLSLQPKDINGNPVIDYNQQIVKTQENFELKEWLALSDYLRSLRTVPEKYTQSAGLKILDDDASLGGRIKNPSGLTMLFFGVSFMLILGLIVVVTTIIRKKNKNE